MKKYMPVSRLTAVIILTLLVTGCLVSGTFIVVESFRFTTQTGFYHYFVDITDEADWEDHKDEIDNIDLVGFELWFTNDESSEVTFHVYVDDGNEPAYTNYAEVYANATKVLNNITLPVGPSHITYGSSFAYITNVDKLKEYAKSGTFHFYGVSSSGTTTDFTVDSGKVIVTFTASK